MRNPVVVGILLGTVFSFIFLVALPMHHNHQKNGCVFLVCE